MSDFYPGQRWINNAEPELGLGTIIEVEHRTVTVLFSAAEETRIYAKQNIPLTRIQFTAGESITSIDEGILIVSDILEQDGMLIYEAQDQNNQTHQVPETRLDPYLKISGARERLFSEQIDRNIWFELRCKTLQESNRLVHSDLLGLSGCRTSLIPHQLYIASEVGKRYAPRVLLADEVGLGKTIEAGMILHQQLLRGQSQRVLVLVPETLQHQWLVEMLRKFHLRFSLYDAERFREAIESEPDSNPLLNSQLVICSLDFIKENELHERAVISGEWDLLIVDEAHHLKWSKAEPDPAYLAVEKLTNSTAAVLLLTATPEQLGRESHFARLRLLDSNRFNDYETFLQEEKDYQPVAELIDILLEGQTPDEEQLKLLATVLPEVKSDYACLSEENRNKAISLLLDQQGTGRILFRNTRSSVKGFPERIVSGYSLSSDYDSEDLASLCPEQFTDTWTVSDPRVIWLINFLKRHPKDKALLITARAETALDLTQYLRINHNIHAAVFHEGMTIIERDKAAAFFADIEDGSQILICSEIGGEGRNFQFASHLILFDLPINPDLLEQRIGRIDRIGQGDEIFIHVPYLANSAQEILYRWYFEGLRALQENCPAAQTVYQTFRRDLHECFNNPAKFDSLLDEARSKTAELNEVLHDGRDKLLELNSFRPEVANALVSELASNQDEDRLEEYMTLVFDCFGVDKQVHGENTFVLHPGSTMHEAFPCLPDEGTTITFNRETALKYEDIDFISWEHEMVTSIMENISLNEKGNAAVTLLEHPALEKNTILVECLFTLDVIHEVQQYLPASFIRTVVSEDKRNFTKALSQEIIQRIQKPLELKLARQLVKMKKKELESTLDRSEQLARQQTDELRQLAIKNADEVLKSEAQRLQQLALLNPNVRQDEIDHFESMYQKVARALAKPSLRLNAVRVLLTV